MHCRHAGSGSDGSVPAFDGRDLLFQGAASRVTHAGIRFTWQPLREHIRQFLGGWVEETRRREDGGRDGNVVTERPSFAGMDKSRLWLHRGHF